MSFLKKSFAVASVIALTAGTAMAAPVSPAGKLSVAQNVRVGAPAKAGTKSQLGGGSTGLIVLAVLAIGAGIAIAAGGGSKSP